MSVTSNSDDERYANESFESPSENDIVETSDINSEIEYAENDVECYGDAVADAKPLPKQMKNPNKYKPKPTTSKYPGSFILSKMKFKERISGDVGNTSESSSNSSSNTESEIENEDNNDGDDDSDVIVKQQSLSNFSTLSMNFDVASLSVNKRSAGVLPISRNQHSQRNQRKGNQDVCRKTSLDSVIEKNENSEYCTDDEDYERIKEMEKFYRSNLFLEQHSLSAKKRHTNRSGKKVTKKLSKKTNEQKQEAEETQESEQEPKQKLEQKPMQDQYKNNIEESKKIEKQLQESIVTPEGSNNAMMSKESDIIAASRMLQPMENLFDQLKLPNTDDVAKSLINVVKSSIVKQTTSFTIAHNEKVPRVSPRKSKSYTYNKGKCLASNKDNMKPLNDEMNQSKLLQKYDDNYIGDHCRKEYRQNNRKESAAKMEEERKQLKHIEEGYISCESFDELEYYSEQMPSYSVSTNRSSCANKFNSDDCLFRKTRFNGSQKAPIYDTHKLPPHPRKSWTFTNDRMREIERHNHILLRKILSQKSTNKQIQSKCATRKQQEQERSLVNCAARVTSSSLNRKKQQRQIDFENRILQKKLEAISLRRPQLP